MLRDRLARPTLALGLPLLAAAGVACAHDVAPGDLDFVVANTGASPVPYMYLGAKHMVTGLDHLLFLTGVIFFLYRLKDVALYVSIFALGHSATLIAGVLGDFALNAYLVDAVIGLSVVYKAFDNLDGLQTLFGFRPDTRLAVLFFGFFHGLGLADRLQALSLSPEGLLENLLAFNIGVELGQLMALTLILTGMSLWRTTRSFGRLAVAANVLLMTAGFSLAGYQLTGYWLA